MAASRKNPSLHPSRIRKTKCIMNAFRLNKLRSQFVTALEIPIVESPITAVRAVIVAESNRKK